MHEGYCACVQAAQHAQMLQEEAIKQVDLRRRMRATVVPALDKDVRAMLRQLGEPVTLFGEQEVCTCQSLQLCCMMHLKREVESLLSGSCASPCEDVTQT